MKALLVVDVDLSDGWVDEIDGHPLETQKIVAAEIRKVLERERKSKGLIAFVVYGYGTVITGQEAQLQDGRQEADSYLPLTPLEPPGCIICADTSYRLARFLGHRHGEHFEAAFVKRTGDAFTNRRLTDYLRFRNVKEVVLAGCSTQACIRNTAAGAVKNGFKVTLFKRCSFPPFSGTSYDSEDYWLERVRAEGNGNGILAEIEIL